MNDEFFQFALARVDGLTSEEIEQGLIKAGFRVVRRTATDHPASNDSNRATAAMPAPMCERKTNDIIEREGYAKTGYVLKKAGAQICVSDGGAVAWFTPEQWHWLMFNRDHITFDWPAPFGSPAPATAPELDVEAERRELTDEEIDNELESARECIVEGFGYKYNENDLAAAIRRLAAQSTAPAPDDRLKLDAARKWIASAPHGENCFLHDEGEYDRCFCGKEALEAYLESDFEAAQVSTEQAGDASRQTLMTEEQAEKWAWEQVKADVGTKGWTAGESCTYYGFFLWGWRYRTQYKRQRSAPSPNNSPVGADKEPK